MRPFFYLTKIARFIEHPPHQVDRKQCARDRCSSASIILVKTWINKLSGESARSGQHLQYNGINSKYVRIHFESLCVNLANSCARGDHAQLIYKAQPKLLRYQRRVTLPDMS